MLGSGLVSLSFPFLGMVCFPEEKIVCTHGKTVFPKYILTSSFNLDSEILGSADRFLLADPHVQNTIWSLKFCMDVESK